MTEHAADMPLLVHRALRDAVEGRLEVNWKSDDLRALRREMEERHRNTIGAIGGSAMLLSGALFLTLGPSILLPAYLVTGAGTGLSIAGILVLAYAWLRT